MVSYLYQLVSIGWTFRPLRETIRVHFEPFNYKYNCQMIRCGIENNLQHSTDTRMWSIWVEDVFGSLFCANGTLIWSSSIANDKPIFTFGSIALNSPVATPPRDINLYWFRISALNPFCYLLPENPITKLVCLYVLHLIGIAFLIGNSHVPLRI